MEKVHVDYINYIRSLFNKSPYVSLFASDVVTFICCQFALESNYGKSRKAEFYHNHSGMRFPVRRPTLAHCSVDGFSSYRDDQTCVDDYILRTLYCCHDYIYLLDVSRFTDFLVRTKYCSLDSGYISKISKIMLAYEKNSSFSA